MVLAEIRRHIGRTEKPTRDELPPDGMAAAFDTYRRAMLGDRAGQPPIGKSRRLTNKIVSLPHGPGGLCDALSDCVLLARGGASDATARGTATRRRSAGVDCVWTPATCSSFATAAPFRRPPMEKADCRRRRRWPEQSARICSNKRAATPADSRDLAACLPPARILQRQPKETCGAGWIAQVNVRGPWFCRAGQDAQRWPTYSPPRLRPCINQGGQGHKVGALLRLDPLDKRTVLPGWNPPLPAHASLVVEGARRHRAVLGLSDVQGTPGLPGGRRARTADDHLLPEEEIFGFDRRTGIGVEAERKHGGKRA